MLSLVGHGFETFLPILGSGDLFPMVKYWEIHYLEYILEIQVNLRNTQLVVHSFNQYQCFLPFRGAPNMYDTANWTRRNPRKVESFHFLRQTIVY